MADYCQQCSIDIFGKDYEDFKGMVGKGDILNDICEGCGRTNMDHTGKCLGNDKQCKGGHKNYHDQRV